MGKRRSKSKEVGQKRKIDGKEYERVGWNKKKSTVKSWKDRFPERRTRVIKTRKTEDGPIGYGLYAGPKK